MNTSQSVTLYHGITNLRAEILEEAQHVSIRPKKARRTRWIAAAACLCLIAGTAAALTATEFGTRLIRSFRLGTDSGESGYELSIGIEKISAEELTGDIQSVPEQIRAQYEEYDAFSSWFPGHWQKEFPSSAQARKFVGYAGLTGLDWDLVETKNTLDVHGDRDGNIQSIGMETAYQVGDIRIQAFSKMYTEHYTQEVTTGSYTTEYVEFTTAYRTTESGTQYHVISGTPMESGYRCLDGYLVDNSVLYHLHISYQSEDAGQAEELLRQWAQLF